MWELFRCGVRSGRGPKSRADDLHRAAETGDINGLQAALASGADIDGRDGRGWTALMHAVNKGYPLLVEPLLAAGADVDMRAPDGATALFMAAALGHSEIIALLMKAGADVSVRGPAGQDGIGCGAAAPRRCGYGSHCRRGSGACCAP